MNLVLSKTNVVLNFSVAKKKVFTKNEMKINTLLIALCAEL